MTKLTSQATKYIGAAKKALKAGSDAPLFPLSTKPKASDMSAVKGASFTTDGFTVEVFKGKRPSVPVYLSETNDEGTRWLKINAQVGYEVFGKK
jgi:hypothetical protein